MPPRLHLAMLVPMAVSGVVIAPAVVLILPAFAYLLWLTQSERWSRT